MSKFKTSPLTLKEANEFVLKYHRHNGKMPTHRFSIGAIYNNELVGVAIIGNPCSRRLNNKYLVEVRRLCVKDDSPKNTCSYLYGRCWNIWQMMGGKKIITYTYASESGSSMRAVNWLNDHTVIPRKKEWNNWKSRKNRNEQISNYQLKFRWVKELNGKEKG
ncbi:hypothetical protein [uncultured Mediterranean phage uvDeep-CGR2-AD8-C175]|nr:hypothetical protein [uncultured Mediterranean phage uvDeep-CGR2-AD8-C175]